MKTSSGFLLVKFLKHSSRGKRRIHLDLTFLVYLLRWFFFGLFEIFLKLLSLLLKDTKVTTGHGEFEKGLWLQGKAASQTHSFRDAEPRPVIPQNAKKNYGIFPLQLRPSISTSMSSRHCLPLTSVLLALHDKEVLSVTAEAVNLELEMGWNIPCYVFNFAWLCGSASKWALKTWCWWGFCK